MMPLCNFKYKSCLVHNCEMFKIFSRNFVQKLSIIRHCAENKNHNSIYKFYGIMPHCNFKEWKSCLFHNSETVRYFLETLYKYKASSDKVQRTRTISSPKFFYRIMSLCNFKYGNCVWSLTLKPFEIFSQNCVQIQSIIRWYAENKNNNSIYMF